MADHDQLKLIEVDANLPPKAIYKVNYLLTKLDSQLRSVTKKYAALRPKPMTLGILIKTSALITYPAVAINVYPLWIFWLTGLISI